MLQPDPNERFRMRRNQARRRRAARRLGTFTIVALAVAVVGLGARFLTPSDQGKQAEKPASGATTQKPKKLEPRPLPSDLRGVHVTMALMTLEGKLDEYLSYTRHGLTAIQLDVKDENGEVAFQSPRAPLARRIGAAQTYYRPKPVVAKIRSKGLYLIGRVVVFEDPILSRERPQLAIQRSDGSVWTNSGGLGWANPYDERVWDYNVDIAESAARAGFDEIMFDYVRFPTDGDVESAVFPGKTQERKGVVVARFLEYARERLNPLGVRVSAAIFGLSATRDLGIGQRPKLLAPHLDAVYPMVYPSHFGSGEYGIDDPNANPGATITMSLRTFKRALRDFPDVRITPWLQDFTLGRTYTEAEVAAQIVAARRVGAFGFLLWNAGGLYIEQALDTS